jgi:hypothetical protein
MLIENPEENIQTSKSMQLLATTQQQLLAKTQQATTAQRRRTIKLKHGSERMAYTSPSLKDDLGNGGSARSSRPAKKIMACRSDKCMQYFGTSAGHAEARWCNS